MSALNQVTEYLVEKVRKVNVNNPKANTGGVLLKLNKQYEVCMAEWVSVSFQCIQMHFTKDSSSDPAGTGQLTAISTLIGRRVLQVMGKKWEDFPWNSHVRLGDLFIEAYYNCGFVNIYYPKQRDTSYIVSATNKWVELADLPELTARVNLKGSTATRPKDITTMLQVEPLRAVAYNHDESIISWSYGPGFISDDNPRNREYSETVVKGCNPDTELNLSAPWVKAMNKLQQTGWRINRRILKALIDNKEKFVQHEPIEGNDAKELKRRSKVVEWGFITRKAELLSQANVFYQYMEADYRGRLYYSEPFLNYQGSDLARGMLKFARSRPMTDEGLWWLAVHTANSYNESYGIDEIPEWAEEDYKTYLEDEGLESISVDKMTLEDRVRWTNANMQTIIGAGEQSYIFSEAEKPVSFLAACIEWYDYQQATNDGRIHMSHLPIGIDGSNNGWQHLGAISRDTRTGELVGLAPVKIQKDFYVQTAKELYSLTEDRLKDILDSMPMKHIRKGISKRGSMTRAYSAGAGKIGENMWFDCKTEDFHDIYGINEDDCNSYAKLLIKAINTVCPGPLDTMEYLQNLAAFEIGKYEKMKDGEKAGKEYNSLVKKIKELYTKRDKTDEELEELNAAVKETDTYDNVKVYGNGRDYLTWVTPSGFYVKYTNFITTTQKTRGTISGYKTEAGGTKTITHVARVPTKRPDMRGFMCGVSPNFIHSLDASHMALVIDDWTGDFGAVHDSFATHASDVDDLLAVTKRVFVEMYDVDNFYNYIEDQLITNKEGLDVAQPTLGHLDIGGIYESDYFFA